MNPELTASRCPNRGNDWLSPLAMKPQPGGGSAVPGPRRLIRRGEMPRAPRRHLQRAGPLGQDRQSGGDVRHAPRLPG